jgi:hypothetical protein
MQKNIEKYGKDFIIGFILKEGRYTSELSSSMHPKLGFNNGMRFDLMNNEMYNYLCHYIDFKETLKN